jgi:hypothetical protein
MVKKLFIKKKKKKLTDIHSICGYIISKYFYEKIPEGIIKKSNKKIEQLEETSKYKFISIIYKARSYISSLTFQQKYNLVGKKIFLNY